MWNLVKALSSMVKIYTSTFKNLTQENSDFVVQIPNHKTLSAIKTIIGELNTEVGLTSDEILSKIRKLILRKCFFSTQESTRGNRKILLQSNLIKVVKK